MMSVPYALDDVLIAARTVYGEARDQPFRGQKAVAHVIRNRAVSGKDGPDHSIAAAALRHRQFSAWNRDNPNREKALAADVSDAAFRRALHAVLEALDENDFTKGAEHYHARWIKPEWAVGHTPVAEIGDHIFYNGVE